MRHRPLGEGSVDDALQTRYSPTCVITLNLVVLRQTVWAQIAGSQKSVKLGPAPWGGSVADTQETRSFPTCSLFTICGDACPLLCVSAQACLTGWPNA